MSERLSLKGFPWLAASAGNARSNVTVESLRVRTARSGVPHVHMFLYRKKSMVLPPLVSLDCTIRSYRRWTIACGVPYVDSCMQVQYVIFRLDAAESEPSYTRIHRHPLNAQR